MHARTATLSCREGQLDRVITLCKESAEPALERQDGFMGLTIGANRQENRVFTLTLWENEEAMTVGERGEYLQEQISKLIPLLSVPPDIGHYGVEHIS